MIMRTPSKAKDGASVTASMNNENTNKTNDISEGGGGGDENYNHRADDEVRANLIRLAKFSFINRFAEKIFISSLYFSLLENNNNPEFLFDVTGNF